MTFDQFEWPPHRRPEPVGLRITPRQWAREDDLWALLRAEWADAEGWVCLPHALVEWPHATASGPILSAELARPAGASIHVRRSAEGWTSWVYEEEPSGRLVRFREWVVSTAPGREHMGYAVYWAPQAEDDGVEVYRPYASRFTGWGSP